MTLSRHRRPAPSWQRLGTTRFLLQALRTPRQIGAIAPSGRRLAAQAASLIASDRPQTIVELGPGTGVITDALHARRPPDSTLCAVEINAAMAGHLTDTRPWLQVIHGDAAELQQLLQRTAIGPVDLIISAMPWSVLPPAKRNDILDAITEVLSPHGTLATVVTLPVRRLQAIRDLRLRLDTIFGQVRQTSTIWPNIPPANLWVCTNPRKSRRDHGLRDGTADTTTR